MAVDSFLAFKKLMVKRNQELNRQAMEMFNKKDLNAAETPKDPTATGVPVTAAAETTDQANKGGPKLSEEEQKKQQDELREVMRVAHSLERAEEEEMMKRALEESEKLKTEE